MNNLYGSRFIEKQRRSGYKSSVYAMAEIVDNSVDAGATEVSLIFIEKEHVRGEKKTIGLSEVYFIDNGSGMGLSEMNRCLTFSEGEGKSDSRIGAFGVGLPNSSISVCRRVEVFSKDKKGHWNYVFLDLDDQLQREHPGFDKAVMLDPDCPPMIDLTDAMTIVKWSKLDLVDVSRADTLMNRADKLLGRIYRYRINNGLSLQMGSALHGNSEFTKAPLALIPYDPLFVMKNKNFITEHIWKASEVSHKDPELGDDPRFDSKNHYKKFVKDCELNETNLPLFQKYDDFWDVEYPLELCGVVHKFRIRASYANSSISNPGLRSGGGTEIGKLIGEKMSGKAHFRSANIFFVRANREIDFGSFGLYTVTDEKNRFWTIEVHFDSSLDDLMGVGNTKQSVDFKFVQNSDLTDTPNDIDLPEGKQRELLYAEISTKLKRCIKEMRKDLTAYARAFKNLRQAELEKKTTGPTAPIPKVESAVIEVIPKSAPWTDDQKHDVAEFLKSRYMHLEQTVINAQVELFSQGLTKTIVLYSPNQTMNLFELVEKRGKLITLINTEHIYYQNIIQPLKSHKHLKIFAIAIEMLLSSCALEMDHLINDNEEKYKGALDNYLLQLSSRLNEFINDSRIKVVPEEFERKLAEELEDEDDEDDEESTD
jgi:hypothetical protein